MFTTGRILSSSVCGPGFLSSCLFFPFWTLPENLLVTVGKPSGALRASAEGEKMPKLVLPTLHEFVESLYHMVRWKWILEQEQNDNLNENKPEFRNQHAALSPLTNVQSHSYLLLLAQDLPSLHGILCGSSCGHFLALLPCRDDASPWLWGRFSKLGNWKARVWKMKWYHPQ